MENEIVDIIDKFLEDNQDKKPIFKVMYLSRKINDRINDLINPDLTDEKSEEIIDLFNIILNLIENYESK